MNWNSNTMYVCLLGNPTVCVDLRFNENNGNEINGTFKYYRNN